MKEIHVAMGAIEVSADQETKLITFVGSCVALCLYDPLTKIAGMSHVMLPKNTAGQTKQGESGKYADQAIETTIQMMVEKGADLKRIKASIAGGAKIFTSESGDSIFNIGEKNAISIKEILREKRIPLISSHLGMTYGRWVKLDINTGKMTVSNNKHKEELVCEL
jgi:chemotaxis protein CheD